MTQTVAPLNIVTNALALTLSGAPKSTAKTTTIRFLLPLQILPEKLRTKKSASSSLKGIITLKDENGRDVQGWEAKSVGAQSDPYNLWVDLTNPTPKKSVVMVIPVQVAKLTISSVSYGSLRRVRGRLHYEQAGTVPVGVAPSGSPMANKPLPQPKVSLTSDAPAPTALKRGSRVKISWRVDHGIQGTLKGLLPNDENELTLSTDARSKYPLSVGYVEVWVMSTQVYELEVTVALTANENVTVTRTLTFDPITADEYGYVEISPIEALPYGEVTVDCAVWNVSQAMLDVQNVRGKGDVHHQIAGSADKPKGAWHANYTLPVPLTTVPPVARLSVTYGVHSYPLSPEGDFAIRTWKSVIGKLPVAKKEAVLGVCYAEDTQSNKGVLALCSADKIWLADVGINDESGEGVKFKKTIYKPAGAVQFRNVVPHEKGFCALIEMPHSYEVATYGLDGRLIGTPIATPRLANEFLYTIAFPKKEIRAYRLDNLNSAAFSITLDPNNAYLATGEKGNVENNELFLDVTPDGNYAVATFGCIKKGRIVRLDLRDKTADHECELPAHVTEQFTYAAGVRAIAISPSGRFCATQRFQIDTVDVWNLERGTIVASLATKGVKHLLFPMTDNYVVTNSGDSQIHIWDIATASQNINSTPTLVEHPVHSQDVEGNVATLVMDNANDLLVAIRKTEFIWAGAFAGAKTELRYAGNMQYTGDGFGRKSLQYALAFAPTGGTFVEVDSVSSYGPTKFYSLYDYSRSNNQIGEYSSSDKHGGFDMYRRSRKDDSRNFLQGIALSPDKRKLMVGYRVTNTAGATAGNHISVYDLQTRQTASITVDNFHGSVKKVQGQIVMVPAWDATVPKLFTIGQRPLVIKGRHAYSIDPQGNLHPEPALSWVTGRRFISAKNGLYAVDVATGQGDLFYYGPGGLVNMKMADAVDGDKRSLLANGTATTVDGLLVILRGGDGDPPQDWVYNPQNDKWVSCGHGLDATLSTKIAYRRGKSPRLWAVGGKPVGAADNSAMMNTLLFDHLGVFDPAYSFAKYKDTITVRDEWAKRGSWTTTYRGVLVVGGWKTTDELKDRSEEQLHADLLAVLKERLLDFGSFAAAAGLTQQSMTQMASIIVFIDHSGAFPPAPYWGWNDFYNALFSENSRRLNVPRPPQSERAAAQLIDVGCRWAVDFVSYLKGIKTASL